jgi:hypothetical protein
VVPSDLGVTLDINKATGETQIDVQSRIADRPMCEDLDGLITSYLQDDLGLPVKMQTSYSAEKQDRVADANVWKIGTEGGAVTVDEWRSEMFGLEVDSDRPVPRFVMTSRAGPIPLANLFAIAGPINPATGGPLDTVPLLDTGKQPFEAAAGITPGKTMNTPGALVSTFNPDEPQFPQDELAATPAPTTIAAVAKSETEGITSETGIVGYDEFVATHPEALEDDEDEEQAAEVAKELSRWRDNARGRVKAGKAPRQFQSTILPPATVSAVWKALEAATTRTQVDAIFAEVAAPRVEPALKAEDVSALVLAELAPDIADLHRIQKQLATAEARAHEAEYLTAITKASTPRPTEVRVYVPETAAPEVRLLEQRAPEVNVTVQPAMVEKQAVPAIHVHVPEQKAPDIHVAPPEVHVAAPVVKVDVAAPRVDFHAEQPRARKTTFRKGEDGSTIIERGD